MPFEPETFTDARIASEYRTLRILDELASDASNERPVYTEIDQKSALAQIIDILDDDGSLAFASLISDPPPGTLAYDGHLVSIIIVSLNIFIALSNAALFPQNRRLDVTMRMLWPHIVRWGAVLHPARGRLIRAPGPGDARRNVTAVVQAYLSIFQSPDIAYLKSFLHGNPDAVTQTFELWLRLPHYCSKSAIQEASKTVDGVITLFVILETIFLNDHATTNDRALFENELFLTIGYPRTLYRAVSRQTLFLAKLTAESALVPARWSEHFSLLARCLFVCVPRCPQPRRPAVPKKAIFSTVSAAILCVKIQAPGDAALCALGLLTCLCRAVASNRPLAHAIDAGVFDLLRDLGRPQSDTRDVIAFIQQLCSGLFNPRVSRVFNRRHPNVPHVAPSPARCEPGHIPDWQDVAILWSSFLKPYIETYDSRSADSLKYFMSLRAKAGSA
ncbi:hypothetical protein BD626DRAFT_573882 [Schizophyllum amplum]|uniref:Uncharacterized protein n=1 Tax=Schizophyllum amplum TaxID=97359 RepID=A0A550BZT4_9AGAR|nr:hypothetical protein BD626DRAFT_573882 [Auriculariopsis ampla]